MNTQVVRREDVVATVKLMMECCVPSLALMPPTGERPQTNGGFGFTDDSTMADGNFTVTQPVAVQLPDALSDTVMQCYQLGEFTAGVNILREYTLAQSWPDETESTRDHVAYALAWGLFQMELAASLIHAVLPLAATDTARARVLMLTAISLIQESAMPEPPPNALHAIGLVNGMNTGDLEVGRLLKAAADLRQFLKVKNMHLANISQIASFAVLNQLSKAQLIELFSSKQCELGYTMSQPTLLWDFRAVHFVGRRLVPEPLTVVRPPAMSGTQGLDCIDAVLYINLKHRTDRASVCAAHLSDVFGPHKVARHEAIHNKERGRLGCNASHVSALLRAKAEGWRSVLICEDDVEMLVSSSELNAHLWECLRSARADAAGRDGWDVIMLGAYVPHCRNTGSPHLKRTYCATTSHCYLVHGHYYDTLIAQLQRCSHSDVQFDLGWWPLQQRDLWFVVDPVMAAQRDSQSDVTGQRQTAEVQMMATGTWDTKIVASSIHCYNSQDDVDFGDRQV